MTDEKGKSKKEADTKGISKLWLKILVPVLIVAAVGAIFLFKNSDKGDVPNPSSSTAQQTASNNGQTDYKSAEFDLEATDNFDLQKILSYKLPVIIDFGADSCIPCKEMAPVLKELNQELRGKAIVKFVDVWKNPDAANSVPLKVIPTQFFFDKDGKPYVPKNPENSPFTLYSSQKTKEHVFTSHEGGMDKASILAVLKELGVE